MSKQTNVSMETIVFQSTKSIYQMLSNHNDLSHQFRLIELPSYFLIF